ncbi:MAG: hypothetical protein MUC86_13510 [Burkholderiaceae bacterium]|jgi:hypothetical protein|nr:hypothetical protein [Burkholderiaceae bacterium]
MQPPADTMKEKCTQHLPQLRVGEALEVALMRLAAADHRTLSEYLKLVLTRHVYGHGETMSPNAEEHK